MINPFDQNVESGSLVVTPVFVGEPRLLRLCTTSGDCEELVLSVQGFVTQLHLPPISSRKQYVCRLIQCLILYFGDRLPSKPLYMSQSVDIVGFGDPNFDSAVEALQFLNAIFQSSPDCKGLQPFVTQTWRNQLLISASNRYFTLQSDAPHEVLTSFSNDIDLKGILGRFAQSSSSPLVNLEENRVRYFKRLTDDRTGTYAFSLVSFNSLTKLT